MHQRSHSPKTARRASIPNRSTHQRCHAPKSARGPSIPKRMRRTLRTPALPCAQNSEMVVDPCRCQAEFSERSTRQRCHTLKNSERQSNYTAPVHHSAYTAHHSTYTAHIQQDAYTRTYTTATTWVHIQHITYTAPRTSRPHTPQLLHRTTHTREPTPPLLYSYH